MDLLPAEKVRRKVHGKGIIGDYVKDILIDVEMDIQKAIDERRKYSVTSVQTNFQIPTMEPAQAQMRIYYHLIKLLEKKGYRVEISFEGRTANEQKVWIIVRWMRDEDIRMEQYMCNFIQSRMTHRDSVEGYFVNRDDPNPEDYKRPARLSETRSKPGRNYRKPTDSMSKPGPSRSRSRSKRAGSKSGTVREMVYNN